MLEAKFENMNEICHNIQLRPFHYFQQEQYLKYKAKLSNLSHEEIAQQMVIDWERLQEEGQKKYEDIKLDQVGSIKGQLQELYFPFNKEKHSYEKKIYSFQINYCCSKKEYQQLAQQIQEAMQFLFPDFTCNTLGIGGTSGEVIVYVIKHGKIASIIWNSKTDFLLNVGMIKTRINYIFHYGL